MATAIRKLTAVKCDVYGIRHWADVVVGVVTGMPVRGLRLLRIARSLLVRLPWGVWAGQTTGNPFCLRFGGASTCPALERTRSGGARLPLDRHPGGPRSARWMGRF
jgi:hypothetical protein